MGVVTNKMRTLEQAFLTFQEKYSSRDLQIHSPQGRKPQKRKEKKMLHFIYGLIEYISKEEKNIYKSSGAHFAKAISNF